MTRALPLPRPHPENGRYDLPDGSIIYRSGCDALPVRPGKFFAWLRTGVRTDSQGRKASDGRILLEKRGIRYFDTAEQALAALLWEKRG